MHDPDSVDVACSQFVQRYNIFRVVVPDLKQVGNLTIGIFRQIAAYLHIDALITIDLAKNIIYINSFC